MSANYQRSNKLNFQKLSKTAQDISKDLSNISNEDLIEYLEVQNQEQQKRDKVNFRINLTINIIIVICTIVNIVITIFK